jgi:hypothetical protein
MHSLDSRIEIDIPLPAFCFENSRSPPANRLEVVRDCLRLKTNNAISVFLSHPFTIRAAASSEANAA